MTTGTEKPKTNNGVDEFYRVTGETCRTVIAVIDALTQRGGFRGEELSAVGKIRDNCLNLVQTSEQRENAKTETKS